MAGTFNRTMIKIQCSNTGMPIIMTHECTFFNVFDKGFLLSQIRFDFSHIFHVILVFIFRNLIFDPSLARAPILLEVTVCYIAEE